MRHTALKPEPSESQIIYDASLYDLGFTEGQMKAQEQHNKALFNPISNIIHECINLVGVQTFLLYTQRVIGCFMTEHLDNSCNPEDLDIVADHMRVSELLEEARTCSASRRIDERRTA